MSCLLQAAPAQAQGYPGGGYPGGSTSGHWEVSYMSNGTNEADAAAPVNWVANHTHGMANTITGSYHARAAGSVQAKLTWTPAPDQTLQSDPPPATIYVKEWASAIAEGYYTAPDAQGNTTRYAATIAVDNGLGTAVQETVSAGAMWRKKRPPGTSTVRCRIHNV